MRKIKNKKKKEITEGKMYSPFGRFAERAKLPSKWAWLWSYDVLKFLVPYDISGMSKAREVKFCTVVRQVALGFQTVP